MNVRLLKCTTRQVTARRVVSGEGAHAFDFSQYSTSSFQTQPYATIFSNSICILLLPAPVEEVNI